MAKPQTASFARWFSFSVLNGLYLAGLLSFAMAGTTRKGSRGSKFNTTVIASPKFSAPTNIKPVFSIDASSMANFFLFLKEFGLATTNAIPEFLNHMAFEARRASEKEVRRAMTVRMKTLLPFYSVKKAKKGSSKVTYFCAKVSTMHVKSPGAPKTRFTGWTEQEVGADDNRERGHTLASRNNSWSRKIAGPNRMKPGTKFMSIEDTKFRNAPYAQRVAKFLTFLRYANYKKPFILAANSARRKPIEHGLYKFKQRERGNKKAGKITMLVNFQDRPRQPRRKSIFVKPIKELLNPAFISKSFRKVYKSELARRGIRKSVRFW